MRSSLPTAELRLKVLARSAVRFLYFTRSLYITLWHNSIASRWLWGFEHVTRAEKKEQKKSLLKKLWVFYPFRFFFCDAAKPKENLNWLRASVTLDIYPQMISQVLAAPPSIHQTCQPAAPQVRHHCRHGPPQHRLDEFVELTTRAGTRGAPTLSSLGHLVFVLISFLFLSSLVDIVTVSVHLGSKALTVHYSFVALSNQFPSFRLSNTQYLCAKRRFMPHKDFMLSH